MTVTIPRLTPEGRAIIEKARIALVGTEQDHDGYVVRVIEYEKHSDSFNVCPLADNWNTTGGCNCDSATYEKHHFYVAREDFGPEGDSRFPYDEITELDDSEKLSTERREAELEASRQSRIPMSVREIQRAVLAANPDAVLAPPSAVRSARRADARRNA